MINKAHTNNTLMTKGTTISIMSVWPTTIKPSTDNHSFNNEQDYPFTPSLSKGYED